MTFEVIGTIDEIEVIAVGRSIHEIARLRKVYGTGRWRRLKGLELRKIYQVVPDARAAEHEHIRVIDESGQDYLYPVSYFVPIAVPESVEKAFALAA